MRECESDFQVFHHAYSSQLLSDVQTFFVISQFLSCEGFSMAVGYEMDCLHNLFLFLLDLDSNLLDRCSEYSSWPQFLNLEDTHPGYR